MTTVTPRDCARPPEDGLHHRTLSRKYESLDYDLIENVIYLEHQHKSRLNTFLTRDLQRWLVIFIIGLATAISGFFAGFVVKYLTTIKFNYIISLAEDRCNSKHLHPNSTIPTQPTALELVQCMWLPYTAWLGWNIIPSALGSLMVTYWAPVAAGSGIPVVKCYLNGVKIPNVVKFKTYVAKLLGVIASVVGGLAVGKEGPFIHCGAVIGAGLSQGKSSSFKYDLKIFKAFRNDREKRDFVSAGASAGVAAAFGAPIGGVLFALEEGASFWNQALTWRIFFCSMMTSFILNLFMSAYNQNAGVLAFYSLVNFGLVEELDYFWFEIPVYICIAILGGIIGASFCFVNMVITRWRNKYLQKRYTKIAETILVSLLTASAGMILILFASECRKLPSAGISPVLQYNATSSSSLLPNQHLSILDPKRLWNRRTIVASIDGQHPPVGYDADDEARKALSGHILTFMCAPGEYSAMSSLWLKTSEGASSTFMVLQEDIWSIKTLSLFLVIYYWLAAITYGLSISSGVFIPSLLIGATGGRLVGLLLRHFLGPLEWLHQLNKFAIIGAASTLGGVVRMTISLTVIIIEATGCISFGLPIMLCLMVSKWVADSFIEGLYDLAIHFANVPFLDWEPPLRSYSIYASDAMSPNVKVLRTTETVANLVHILRTTTHNGFPVVDFDDIDDGNASTRRTSVRTGMQTSATSEQLASPTYTNEYFTPQESPGQLRNLYSAASTSSLQHNTPIVTNSDTQCLVRDESFASNMDAEYLSGSFQRCGITARRVSYGRYRGLVLRWQILVMLQHKIFNENERSFEMLTLPTFQKPYPNYPSLDEVVATLSEAMYECHVDLRSVMNPTCYTVLYSASFPRIYKLFRSLGLRHLVVTDDRNQVVGMLTRKDLARYVRERDQNGLMRIHELKYSS